MARLSAPPASTTSGPRPADQPAGGDPATGMRRPAADVEGAGEQRDQAEADQPGRERHQTGRHRRQGLGPTGVRATGVEPAEEGAHRHGRGDEHRRPETHGDRHHPGRPGQRAAGPVLRVPEPGSGCASRAVGDAAGVDDGAAVAGVDDVGSCSPAPVASAGNAEIATGTASTAYGSR